LIKLDPKYRRRGPGGTITVLVVVLLLVVGGGAVACSGLKEIGTEDVIPDLKAAAAKGSPPDVAQLARDAVAAIKAR
jgi:hypothetical protein